MKWRLISDQSNDAFTNMGIDEAILKSGKPTLRFYSWKPAAVSIGYFQSLHKEINIDLCKEYGIDYVRRITGGGAVFHDEELTYSIVCPESMVPKDIIKSYELICGAIAQGLTDYGIKSTFAPVNDIIASGKKISGNAQTRKRGNMLQHGTIILTLDVDRMFSVLKVPDEKMKDKIIKNVKERVTSVRDFGDVNLDKLKKHIIIRLSEGLNCDFEESSLTEEEKNESKVCANKFKSKKWNEQR